MRARVWGGGLKVFSAYRLKSCLVGNIYCEGIAFRGNRRYLSWEVIMILWSERWNPGPFIMVGSARYLCGACDAYFVRYLLSYCSSHT